MRLAKGPLSGEASSSSFRMRCQALDERLDPSIVGYRLLKTLRMEDLRLWVEEGKEG